MKMYKNQRKDASILLSAIGWGRGYQGMRFGEMLGNEKIFLQKSYDHK